jgi:hypothetical protein
MTANEFHRQHVLTMIEAAQKAGRTEGEIVAIVDRYFGDDLTRVRARRERTLVSRLFGRNAAA